MLSLLWFLVTVFTSAVLLFSVQLMFGKMILPLLGGTPAVWNTCLVFFQAVLLGGYWYAHATTSWLGAKRQAVLHAAVLCLPLIMLPITVPAGWAPPTTGHPIPWLLGLLSLRVGLPFFAAATTAPLIQYWFAQTDHSSAQDPYFLYAASNCGSLVGLLGYPLLVEPHLHLAQQSRLWSGGFVALLILTGGCAMSLWRSQTASARTSGPFPAFPLGSGPVASLTWNRRAWWVMLSFVPSSLLLGVTTYLSTDIAAIPLLWVVPLAIYLLTFILVFAKRPPIPHWIMVQAMPAVVLSFAIAMVSQKMGPIWLLAPLHLVAFFVAAMVCHGQLAQDRPSTHHLTEFYLWLSVGGVLGGLFNVLVAPVIFDTVVEYPLMMALAAVLWPGSSRSGQRPRTNRFDYLIPMAFGMFYATLILCIKIIGVETSRTAMLVLYGIPALICLALFRYRPVRFGLGVVAFLMVGTLMMSGWESTLHIERSFFGVYRIDRVHSRTSRYLRLLHGTTLHGMQSLDPNRRRQPLTYYYPTGPLGQVFEAFTGSVPRLHHVAMVGLGTGSTACYGTPSQDWTFYEIDPAVQRIATTPQYFTFLRDCMERVNVVLGDARLSLMKAPNRHYDLFILDAFSSDAIPMHLLTQEALQLYAAKLADEGLVAFHISNRYLNLKPVVANLATANGFACVMRSDTQLSREESDAGKTASVWMVLARRPQDLERLASAPHWHVVSGQPGAAVWTDDFSNILSVFIKR